MAAFERLCHQLEVHDECQFTIADLVAMMPSEDSYSERYLAQLLKDKSEAPARGLLGSIERSLHRVRHILTPRRKLEGQCQVQDGVSPRPAAPAVLSAKGLCNVSTASHSDPDEVLQELRQALASKGITCKQKGFTLRGKVDAEKGHQLSFELEVCLIQTCSQTVRNPPPPVVGIRRKRLKGDAWCYKRVCEEVLALAQQQRKV
ncbi:Maternal embryonic leucine zipper kinase [Frankliniella fusca]|uniref:non-specific serine/threonine protein kinase n=1 Tax=Frankliniella fusca TaxID=407009 RepID=A0AAE1H3Z2_9NEOP|nr:Maternal embryonic leucine zipper kinase [Frankliniella fusca]